ncbi:hypothetical protein NYP18_09105 [Corynebacterium sp. YIM 101645]|uniref:Uncharacterized protein n=1 Tax=Corynebacterium lemuris TaxID=1859292 RepID=A0ABT2FX53_9CORY|nr:hypothetical protein [Corynebacterium lemuris]MCS5479817.1 hypothetical protein [Corynebacterium lemuris]
MPLAFPHDDDDDNPIWKREPLVDAFNWDDILRPNRDLYKSPMFADLAATLTQNYRSWEGGLNPSDLQRWKNPMSPLIDQLKDMGGTSMSRHLADMWPSIAATLPSNMFADIAAQTPLRAAIMDVVAPSHQQIAASWKIDELNKIIQQNLTIPDPVMETFKRRWGLFQPHDYPMALQLAMTSPKVREVAESFVEENAENVDELAIRVTGKGQVKVSELSKTQRLTLYKEAVNMLAQTAVTSFTAGHPVSIASQVTLSIVMFIFAIVEIEMQIREERNQAEAEGNEIPETE